MSTLHEIGAAYGILPIELMKKMRSTTDWNYTVRIFNAGIKARNDEAKKRSGRGT